jgi:predicted membrane protein
MALIGKGNKAMNDDRGAARGGLGAGLVIIALGVILLLDQEGIVRAWDIWRFWPVILMIVGVARLIRAGSLPDRLWGVVEFLFGLVFQLGALGYKPFEFGRTWPLLIVGAGLWVLYSIFRKRDQLLPRSSLDFSRVDVFGGGKVRVTSKRFRGGKWLAVFGGSQIDFTEADIDGTEATLEVLAVFGGGEIIVPRNWEVQVRGVAFLGGHSEEEMRPVTDSVTPRKTLVVRGAWILGGFNVKN